MRSLLLLLLLPSLVQAQEDNGHVVFAQGLFAFDGQANVQQSGRLRFIWPPQDDPDLSQMKITGWHSDCDTSDTEGAFQCLGTYQETTAPQPTIDITGSTCYVNPLKTTNTEVFWYSRLPYGNDPHVFAWVYTMYESDAAEYFPDCDANGVCDCTKFEPMREGWDTIVDDADLRTYCKFPITTCSFWNTLLYTEAQCNVNFWLEQTIKGEFSRTCVAGASLALVGGGTDPTDPPDTEPPATDPPATDPPATDAPATDPPATEPPATDSPATDPPATDPPATDPPGTGPQATEPPATDPPATDSPATEPPVTEPPATDSPATDAPATEPPATEAPAPAPVTFEVNPWTIQGYEDQTANVGDTVTFTWSGEHSVFIHPTGTCDETGAVEVGVTSPASYTFTEAGEVYFACDVGEHCENGQSIKFTVSDSPAATEPPATEPPATDPPATEPPATDSPGTSPPPGPAQTGAPSVATPTVPTAPSVTTTAAPSAVGDTAAPSVATPTTPTVDTPTTPTVETPTVGGTAAPTTMEENTPTTPTVGGTAAPSITGGTDEDLNCVGIDSDNYQGDVTDPFTCAEACQAEGFASMTWDRINGTLADGRDFEAWRCICDATEYCTSIGVDDEVSGPPTEPPSCFNLKITTTGICGFACFDVIYPQDTVRVNFTKDTDDNEDTYYECQCVFEDESFQTICQGTEMATSSPTPSPTMTFEPTDTMAPTRGLTVFFPTFEPNGEISQIEGNGSGGSSMFKYSATVVVVVATLVAAMAM